MKWNKNNDDYTLFDAYDKKKARARKRKHRHKSSLYSSILNKHINLKIQIIYLKFNF